MTGRLLLLEDEVEGDCMGTTDFVFRRIGDPVRLMSTLSNSAFDLSDPPLQPLAVSETHRLLFLAHSIGFLVANTKDVIGLAKETKENEKSTFIQKSCVVDVQIGRVSILSLSGDSSMLAVTVGRDIHFFAVQALLNKVKEPAFSATLKKSGTIKDLKWQRNSANSFVVLSTHGSLCHGSSGFQLKDVIDNVDAVDWSVDGNFVAIARKDTVSILTSNFKEILSMPLLFQSWIDDSGSEVKVDSIKWVRLDSIVIGCTQLKEDSEDDRYIVQVIASGESNLTEVTNKPLIFSFPDLFEALAVDMLPAGVGPCLLSEYLDCWDVAFICNKRNADQHISLLRWISGDNRYEVVSLELGSDKYIPRIDLQDDGDDNLVLGLALDKISLYEKIKIQLDLESKELSPRCILLCLTCDGKLTLYHTACVFEQPDLPKVVSSHGDRIVNRVLLTSHSAESGLGVTTPRLDGDQPNAISTKFCIGPDKHDVRADVVEQFSHPGSGMIASSYSRKPDIEESNMFSKAGDLGTNTSISEMTNESLALKGSGAARTITSNFTMGPLFEPQIAQKPFVTNFSSESASYTAKETVSSESIGSVIIQGHKSGSQTSKSFGMDSSKTKTLLSSPGESKFSGIVNESIYSPPRNSSADLPSCSQSFGTVASSEKISHSGVPAAIKPGYTGSSSITNGSSKASLARLPDSRQQLPLANTTSSKPRQILEFEPQVSKQFYNVKDVTKELDALLSSIECEGGFKDLCSVIQEQSLLALEAGLDDLSEVLFIYRSKVENQLMEIQLLRNKMLEVSARQVYMECIVQQASDNRYWDIWNSQKLGPEFEAKRLHISNLKQNLMDQLMELERHFNSLEINRFGEYKTAPTGWRAPSGSSSPSRPTQPLHTVYRTVNSQLTAAEQLSECLSKQMAVLNITSSTSEKRNFTRELFQSIGLDNKIDEFVTPNPNSMKSVSYSSNKSSPSSTTLKEHPWKCASTSSKAFESPRRKRDSLDKGWAHFEPSRTTVKRTSKKELVRSNLDITFREAKEVFDSQVKAFDIARTEMRNVSTASSEPFGINKRTNIEVTTPMSKTTFSYSQPLEHPPSKGIQEKSSQKAIDGHSKSVFKWAKNPSDLSSDSYSHSSHVIESATTQPSLSTAPAVFSNYSNNKDEKPGLPFRFNIVASSTVNQSSSAVSKTALESKSTSVSTHQKFSDSVSPVKTAYAAEKRSQLYQESSLKNKADIPANLTTNKNIAASSSTLSTSTAESSVSLPSSCFPTFQFGKPMFPSNFLSKSRSNTSSLFSSELASNSVPFLSSAHSSEVLHLPNEIASELECATSQSTSNSASAKELSSELKTDTTRASTPVTIIAPSTLPSGTNVSVSLDVSDFRPKAGSVMAMSSSIMTTEKVEPLDDNLFQEDEMEEEALDTNSVLNLDSLGGFSLQSTPSSNVLKPNPFGSTFGSPSTGSTSSQLSWNTSPGQLFRPSSFNIPESQPSQSAGPSSLAGVASGGFSGFGQPAQLGAGQQALGSVLGSFGQSRQLGTGMPGFGFAPSGIPAVGSSGGSANVGGFVGAATGGGFAGAATGGGFAGAATGGGFAGVSPNTGGFAGAATLGSGFAGAAASAGGSFGGASSGSGFLSGGFGGFSNIQGGGFSGFGAGKSGAGRPPAELLTQMRK